VKISDIVRQHAGKRLIANASRLNLALLTHSRWKIGPAARPGKPADDDGACQRGVGTELQKSANPRADNSRHLVRFQPPAHLPAELAGCQVLPIGGCSRQALNGRAPVGRTMLIFLSESRRSAPG
jgi:hypothetical protein